MGKRIIFKGVDYSANSFIVKEPTWYLGYAAAQLEGNNTVTSGSNFYLKPADIAEKNLTDKVVKYIKVYCKSNGTLTISHIDSSGNGSVLSSESHVVTQGVNVITLKAKIILSSTRSIGLIGNGITPLWNAAEYGFHFNNVGSTTEYGQKTIPIDLGY